MVHDPLALQGVGTLTFRFGARKLTPYAFYVPFAEFNVLSVSQLAKAGLNVNFNPTRTTVRGDNGALILAVGMTAAGEWNVTAAGTVRQIEMERAGYVEMAGVWEGGTTMGGSERVMTAGSPGGSGSWCCSRTGYHAEPMALEEL